MLVDSQLVPEALVRPGSFVGLMALYESNYLRILHLIPELEQIDGCFKSTVAGDCDLHVEVLERCRYTLTLSLTYRFDKAGQQVSDPNILIRVYLDGQQAEAMAIGDGHQHQVLTRLLHQHRAELDRRWRRNVILNKWLEYLSDQGHLILDR